MPALGWQFALALVYLVWVPSDQTQFAYALAKLWLVLWPLLWWRSLTHIIPKLQPQRSLSIRYGLGLAAMIMFCLGIVGWLLQPVLLALQPEISTRLSEIGLTQTSYLIFALGLSLVHSAFEEWYWRGFVFRGLRTKLNWTAAAVISSVAFSAHHAIVLYQFAPLWLTILGTSAIAVVGYLWCSMYQRSGSLLGSWLSHVVADLAVMAIGYWICFLAA